MNISKIQDVFAAKSIIPLQDKSTIDKVISAVKELLHCVITFGAARALYQAEAEYKKELVNVVFFILESLPKDEATITASDYKEICSVENNTWKIYQEGYGLYFNQWDAEKNEFIGKPLQLAKLETQDDLISFRKNLSEMKQTDDYQRIMDEKLNAIINVDYKGKKLLHHLIDITKEYVFKNSEDYLNQPDNVVTKKIRKKEGEKSISLEKKEISDLNSGNDKEIDDLYNDKTISDKERDEKLDIIGEKYDEKIAIIKENYYEKKDIPLKEIVREKSGSFKEYIEDKIKNHEFSAEDFTPMLAFFLKNNTELTGKLIQMGIDKRYIANIIDDKLANDIKKQHERGNTKKVKTMTTERMNFSQISDMLNHIKRTQGN